MKTLFENKQQALKVRILVWFAVIVAAFSLYSAGIIFTNYGLAEADGGVLKPASVRAALASGIALTGCFFGGGMMLYATLYLLKLEQDSETVVVKTMTALGIGSRQHIFSVRDFKKSAYFEGKLNLDVSVDAPWIKLNVAKRRLPFILDMKADTIELSELKKLAKL